MKVRFLVGFVVLLVAALFVFPANKAMAEKPIILGCPLSTAFLYGWDAERGIKLAVEEINAKGGVECWRQKTPLQSRGDRYAGPGTGRSR